MKFWDGVFIYMLLLAYFCLLGLGGAGLQAMSGCNANYSNASR